MAGNDSGRPTGGPAVLAKAMEGSASQDSYAQNSALQNNNFHAIAKPRLEKAISHLMNTYTNYSRATADASTCTGERGRHGHLTVADLGCSYGRNTLDCALFILQSLRDHYVTATSTAQLHGEREGRCYAAAAEEEEEEKRMEVQYFFSDLPSNDFNALFHALDVLQCRPRDLLPNGSGGGGGPKMYAAGVPGSFYGRLFPSASLDFVVCSYSLHWLSQVPPSILDRSSSSWNGGCTWIHNATYDVLNAYSSQARSDVRRFIQSRAYELKRGGVLFLFLAGSSNSSSKCSQAHHDTIWEIFDLAWFELVEEGIMMVEEREMFNMPIFFLKEDDLKSVIMEAPEFQILDFETVEDTNKQDSLSVQQWLAFLTSVTKPTVDSYLGPCKATQLFERVKALALRQPNFNTRFMHSLVVASLQRL
ncbi:hypothetical protein GOP47_0026232 [Adiantum capillus-veneris]|nr:hypothetical protein GOP47_0026232 [Adiantum capillus-veneris]